MPTITVNKKHFFKLLQKDDISDLEDKIFEFGLELEDDEENEENIKIETPANRYDLLSVEGLATSFGIFIGSLEIPKFNCIYPENPLILINKSSTSVIRPIVVAGVIRNVKFTEANYNSFINLQDKLHQNLGRNRTLVSIGTHDLDTIKGPFYYSADQRNDIKFVPLNQEKEMSGPEIMEFYKKDNNMKKFVSIIEDSEVYPIIRDSNNTVLSLPPLINSDHSKISLNTKNIFIEITATDFTKANIGLLNILTAFSIYSENKFTFEAVKIINESEGNKEFLTPIIENKQLTTSLNYINKIIGINLKSEDECISYLEKMGLKCDSNDNKITVDIPLFRGDLLHECDIAEDLAIAYGYNNIESVLPPINVSGGQYYLNKMTENLRNIMISAGYCECLNFALCSKDDLTTNMLSKDGLENACIIENPKTKDFQVARTKLLPGLLKTLSNNKKNKLPIRLFEVSDVVVLDKSSETGAKNERRLGVLLSKSDTASLGKTHGILDLVFTKLNKSGKYILKESNNFHLIENLQCNILYEDKVIGEMGVIHPDVLGYYNWINPVSYLEINIEPLI